MKSCPKAHCTYPICDCVTDENVPLLRTDQPAPTPRTLEAALECAVETARTSARNDNGTWFLKVHGTDLLNALRELSAKTTEAERLREAAKFRPDPRTLWVVWFEDAVVRPEVFFGDGAEEAARAFYKQKLASWSCHLLGRIPDTALAATRKEEGNG